MSTARKIELEQEAPEDIRQAVKQLSLAYKRAIEPTLDAPAINPLELPNSLMTEQGADQASAASHAMRSAEALLFASQVPLSAADLAAALPPGTEIAAVLMALKAAYANRGVNLVEVGGAWRFQTAADLNDLFVEERHEQKQLSQAALETLAIIAYGQPVTRAEIEAVRGVAVSKGTIDALMEAGWVRIKGRRRTPGRPVTLGTTDAFLQHFGLESLDVLPGRADLEAEGLLSDVIPAGFFADGSEMHHQENALETTGAMLEDEADFVTDFIGDSEPDA